MVAFATATEGTRHVLGEAEPPGGCWNAPLGEGSFIMTEMIDKVRARPKSLRAR